MAFDNNINETNHLSELKGSKFEVADGEPDIIGWDVKNEQGQKIGEVDDLLFDTESLKVRYIIVELDDTELDLEEDKKILVPIGVAEFQGMQNDNNNEVATAGTNTGSGIGDYASPGTGNESSLNNTIDREDVVYEHRVDTDERNYIGDTEDDAIVLVPVTVAQLKELPAYKKGSVTAETETSIRNIFGGLATPALAATYNREEFYDHDHFDESKFYGRIPSPAGVNKLPVIKEDLNIGKHAIKTGGARITSRIVERPVEESITLKQEHITVNRTPVDEPVKSADLPIFKEEELELTEYSEVPIINKEARVVEEISITKDVEEKEETIKETLRNTEVEVEKIDPLKTGRE